MTEFRDSGFKLSALRTPAALLLCLSVALVAQEPAKSAPAAAAQATTSRDATAAADPLANMAWFVGKWKTDVPVQEGRPAVRVDSEIKWSENHRAIVFEVWFTSEGKRDPHYFGMFAWDPGEKTLKMWQVAKDGNLSIGKTTTDGKTLSMETHMVRADGSTQEQRAEIVRDGEDAYNWKVQIQKDGQWVDALKLRYERVSSKTGGMQ